MQRTINFRILLASNSILSFAMGIFMPFWIIFIQDFGGSIESFGFAVGLMALASSITSYLVGRSSDKLGRKGFVIAAGYVLAIVIISYTFITNIIQLYILQVIAGINQAVQSTMESTMLGDYTETETRGTNIGKYHAITGVLSSLALMGGGIYHRRARNKYYLLYYSSIHNCINNSTVLYHRKKAYCNIAGIFPIILQKTI